MAPFVFSTIPSVAIEQARTILQRLFDRAYIGLAAQGFRKARENGVCRYRTLVCESPGDTPETRKCAIGQLMDDAVYDELGGEELEGIPVGNALVLDAVARSNMYGAATLGITTLEEMDVLLGGMWQYFQSAHDDSDDHNPMRGQLQGFANRYGLSVPVVQFNI